MAETTSKQLGWRRVARVGVAVAVGVMIWTQAEQHVSSPATAAWQDAEEDAYFGHDAMAMDELDDLRGGFSIGDYVSYFGAEITSSLTRGLSTVLYVTNITMAGTTIDLTIDGVMQDTSGIDLEVPATHDFSTESDFEVVTIVTPGGGGDFSTFVPADSFIGGLAGGGGVIVSDGGDFTALLSQVGGGAVTNSATNTQNGVISSQTMHLEIELTHAFSSSIALEQIRNQLAGIHREITGQFR